ncbi:MAG: N-6 DNA methylase [Thermoflexales bacterium]|nr:N-6 DNA methylase [Thermoflexales bacterium]
MDFSTLENWLWDAACSIRGPLDAPKFKDYILPLLFFKRLSDVYDDELNKLAAELGSIEVARQLAREDRHLIRFYIPEGHAWADVRANANQLGERLTDTMKAIARENSRLDGVINRRDFNITEAGQRLLDDSVLTRLMEILNRQRLGLNDVEPDILGRAYEYLLRKFAEGSGQSAGEFFTPREVAVLMSYILDPKPGEACYDPCPGSGGLLIKAQLRLRDKLAGEKGKRGKQAEVDRPLRLYGQEINPDTFAMCKMNAIIHDMEAEIALGNTMTAPKFLTDSGGLMQVDLVAANPMWNQNFPANVYEQDTYDRFKLGTPPTSSADWGWVQHMAAHLRPSGKMAVVLDTGAVSRGSGNTGSNKERDVRRAFVEANRVECVILLPENLFYNTSAPGIIMVIHGEGSRPHAGEILLINASKLCAKGRPKNYLTDEHIEQIYGLYRDWQAQEGVSAIITKAEAARNDYNLSPSRYVSANGGEPPLPLEEALVLLAEAEEERAEVDAELDKVLSSLGFAGWRKG